MGFQKDVPLQFEYEYDFAVDGGAVSAIPLRCKGLNALASGLVVTGFDLYVETTFTSAGSATAALGNSVSGTTYNADFFSSAALGYAATKATLGYLIPSDAGAIPKLTVAVAALTAGKLKVVFQAYRP
jgi:hypothetical protein